MQFMANKKAAIMLETDFAPLRQNIQSVFPNVSLNY